MTRIVGLGTMMAPARRGRAAAGFALPGAAPQAAAAPAAGIGLAGLLAVPESAGPAPAERAIRRAEAALAELGGLQLDLLRGGADPARLLRLAALAESPEALADPALREAVQGVALRVRVELARRRRMSAA